MVIQNNVEVVRLPSGGVVPYGDVTSMRVTMQWRTSREDHGVEYSGQGGGYFISGYGMRVEILEIVWSTSSDKVHDQNSLTSRDDIWDD